jgi:hypothetical protein
MALSLSKKTAGRVWNHVNLGNLYSMLPGNIIRFIPDDLPSNVIRLLTAEPPGGRPHHGVNLGNFYRKTSPAEFNYTRGWAYFEDGSVYISSHGQSHDQFQQRMNIAARFIQRPSKVKDALEKKNSNQTQLIMIE